MYYVARGLAAWFVAGQQLTGWPEGYNLIGRKVNDILLYFRVALPEGFWRAVAEVLLNLDYASQLWMEKEIKSVANVTRADVREFLSLARSVGLGPVKSPPKGAGTDLLSTACHLH